MTKFNSISFKNDKLILVNQTKLPLFEKYIITDDYNRIAVAIEKLEVRGAPAIGIAAAYAIALAFKKSIDYSPKYFSKIYQRLAKTRPTAVNLFWALKRMKAAYENCTTKKEIYQVLLSEAKKIHLEDVEMCNNIASNGLTIFKKKLNVLTHCNTGKLATGGNGTALGVIFLAYRNNKIKHVYVDETRPLFQGSRLTAFELSKEDIPFSINTDSTAAFLMQQKKIDLVITGADRIALNGDTANKIGTYNLAILCKHHNIPFYIAAPSSTIDTKCKSGKNIVIEYREKSEINSYRNTKITSDNYDVYSPAFDVTPHKLITGIITEINLHLPPFNFSFI